MGLQRQPGYTTLDRPRSRPPTRSDGPPVPRRSSKTNRRPPKPCPCLASELRQCSQDTRGEANGSARPSSHVLGLERLPRHLARSTLDVLASREHPSRLMAPRDSGLWRELLPPPNQVPRQRKTLLARCTMLDGRDSNP